MIVMTGAAALICFFLAFITLFAAVLWLDIREARRRCPHGVVGGETRRKCSECNQFRIGQFELEKIVRKALKERELPGVREKTKLVFALELVRWLLIVGSAIGFIILVYKINTLSLSHNIDTFPSKSKGRYRHWSGDEIETYWLFFTFAFLAFLNFVYLLIVAPQPGSGRIRRIVKLWLDTKEAELRRRASAAD
jgi:hypothetical protein